ncbi:MAG: PCMD domain-containing protein [Bacteroidales bacterium]|nr:PCMD domain-containing protein [Candidatus Sodaliphilus limicaballi]
MNKIVMCALAVAAMFSLNSCFKDEPLNAECDIDKMTLHVASPENVFFQLSDTVKDVAYSDTVMSITVRAGADVSAVTPTFEITPGATISPASGVTQDFSQGPVVYTVTSQDGKWSRRYTISLVPEIIVVTNDTIKYDFEHFELEPSSKKYYIWHNVLDDGSLGNDWASGNAGFQLSMGSATPEQYPSVPCDEGIDGGHCVKLTTRDTGQFGIMVNKRIAAGNFFLGEFEVKVALLDAMKATRFGKPFTHKPLKFTGFYKYTPGPKYINKQGKEVAGMVDNGSIYAVLYRNHDAEGNPVVLYGDDVQTNPNIVAIAKVRDLHATTEWVEWELDFDYEGREIDMNLLKDRGYNLTVVFSSSVNGDIFEGAVGSQLMVDKVRVVCSHED